MAMPMTMIPMPPIHCRIPRHSRIPGGMSPSPVSTVEPVVVSPETVSNQASTGSRPNSDIRNGSAPKAGTAIQASAVNRNAWSRVMPTGKPRVARLTMTAENTVIPEETRKANQSGLPLAPSTRAGISIAPPSGSRIHEMAWNTWGKRIFRPSTIRAAPRPGPWALPSRETGNQSRSLEHNGALFLPFQFRHNALVTPRGD